MDTGHLTTNIFTSFKYFYFIQISRSGKSFCYVEEKNQSKVQLYLSRASGRMVWLVYAQHWVVMAQACSQPSPSSSSRILISASRRTIRRFVITEKAPTRAFSWLKPATTAFTFKTLLRHYAKRALTPRSLNVKLGL